MKRLQALESHILTNKFEEAPMLLKKYKEMSNLQPDLLRRIHCNNINLEYQTKIENIFRENRHIFEPITEEENDRPT